LAATVMTCEVVGRERELQLVGAFFDGSVESPAGLVLEGEPGIGKSTLWLAAVTMARERGFVVLVACPAQAERGLVHVGLGDLFDGVLDDVIGELSPPRRRALEVALLRDDAAGDATDDRALAVAVHDVLNLLSKRKPVVVGIDDVQWLDPSSASALAFALRRLGAAVRLVIARRLEPSELEQSVDVERLRVGPLSVGALHRLLHDRLGRPFARQTLLRIHERSGGNPFFALELARVLGEDVDPLEPLPVPETLEELLRARLAGLPTTTRDALALASALGTPSEWLLERAGVAPHALDPAVEAHVVERESGAIRFTHPLLSSVLYNDLGAERKVVHERVAAIVSDPAVRARHLALAAEKPDAAIAAALDDASAIAAVG
jgi:hypothetical protein